MPHQSDYLGPLTRGWKEWRNELERHARNEIEIEIARMMFYAGTKVAVDAAARNPLSILTMLREVREFERGRIDGWQDESGSSSTVKDTSASASVTKFPKPSEP